MVVNQLTDSLRISKVKILSAIENDAVRSALSSQLQLSFVALGIQEDAAESAVNEFLDRTRRAEDLRSAERQVKDLLRHLNLEQRIDQGLGHRSELIHSQVRKHLVGPRVLDLGCGDGRVADLVARDGYEVQMSDIVDYRSPSVNLPFVKPVEGESLPFASSSFDTVLLLTVMHHANCPLQVFAEALRVSRGRIIVIESVFGVQPAEVPRGDDRAHAFVNLGDAQAQFLAFIDWFYNRVLHDEVQVPFKFNSPAGWREVFKDFGARELLVEHLGLDQPLVPEYHTLHIVEKALS